MLGQLARDKLFLHGEKARHCRKHLEHAASGDRGFPSLGPGRTLFSTRSRSPQPRARTDVAAGPSSPVAAAETPPAGLGEACLSGPSALQGRLPHSRS